MRTRTLRAALAFVLTLTMAAPLTGCKDSDVLVQLIHDQQNGTVDYTAAPIYIDINDADPDTIHARVSGETDLENEQQRSLPTYNPNPNSTGETDNRNQNDTARNQPATSGTNSGANDTTGDNGTAGGNNNTQTGNDPNNPSGGVGSNVVNPVNPPSQGDTGDTATGEGLNGTGQQPGNNNQGGNTGTGGGGGTGNVYNDGGQYQTLPQNVHTIAAVGQYALIVQMLAGKGALVAADAQWLTSVRASSAFPNEGVENIKTAWTGNGTQAGSVSIAALIAAKPDAVLVGSNTSTLTQVECNQLVAAGIDVVVMPPSVRPTLPTRTSPSLCRWWGCY